MSLRTMSSATHCVYAPTQPLTTGGFRKEVKVWSVVVSVARSRDGEVSESP